jgi:hypothetical protein
MMIKRPKLLQDLNSIEALSWQALELNETVFVCNTEYAALQCAYGRSVSGSLQVALV